MGGSFLEGIAAMEAVRTCPVPVYAVVDGSCASAGTLLVVAAWRRFMARHAFMLIHQVSAFLWGKHAEIEDEMQNLDRFMETLRRIYGQYTNLRRDQIDEILSHDLWFDAEQCLAYGLADEIF